MVPKLLLVVLLSVSLLINYECAVSILSINGFVTSVSSEGSPLYVYVNNGLCSVSAGVRAITRNQLAE